jgi:hypothetical protein
MVQEKQDTIAAEMREEANDIFNNIDKIQVNSTTSNTTVAWLVRLGLVVIGGLVLIMDSIFNSYVESTNEILRNMWQ